MSDPTSTSAAIDGRLPDGGRAMQHAFLWIVASLATAAGIFGFALIVSTEKDREAGRMMISDQKGTPYLLNVFSSALVSAGRPNRY